VNNNYSDFVEKTRYFFKKDDAIAVVQTTDDVEKVIKYFDNYYTVPIDLEITEVEVMKAFFESKNFDRSSAENVTYLILKTAKQSNYKTAEILDALTSYSEVQLNEFLLNILNFNRAKTSTLGVIKRLLPSDQVNRNIRL
jgi:hypothetical protein